MKNKIILGLGNPGEKYKKTRHNAGFLALDKFAKQKGLSFKKEYNTLITKFNNLVLVKPLTFMNLSGNVLNFLFDKFSTNEILVLVDDVYLSLGDLRIRKKGGAGGHNGVKSIIQNYGSNVFNRIRIGIDAPGRIPFEKYVLGKFSSREFITLNQCFEFTTKLLEVYSIKDFQTVMDYYSKNKKSYSEKILKSQDL